MVLNYKGCTSSKKKLPGGGPQGSRLGMFIFLILINFVGPGNTSNNIGENNKKKLSKRKPIKSTHMKFIDDMTLLESINLKANLVSDPDPSPPQPPQFRCRTGHVLPPENTQLQTELDKIYEYAEQHEMKVNKEKTKIMIFNTAKKSDCLPSLSIGESRDLEVVESMKLLGVIIQSDMKWGQNTDFICKKGFSRLWMLRRLKGLGASQHELLDVYKKQVLCVMEMAVAAWAGALTKNEKRQIERVQKCAFSIILGSDYECYEDALFSLGMKTLEERRIDICTKFATKVVKHENYKNWFCMAEPSIPVNTRSGKTKSDTAVYKQPKFRTSRYNDSPIPHLTRLLNLKNATHN